MTRSSPLAAAGDTLTMTTAAVFDGHAGAGIARAAAQSLPGRLEQAYLRDGFTAGEGQGVAGRSRVCVCEWEGGGGSTSVPVCIAPVASPTSQHAPASRVALLSMP